MPIPAKKWLASFIIVSIIVLACSCTLANQPPVITSIEAEPEIILALDSCQIECLAVDEEGDELSYEWSTPAGTLSGNSSTVVWNAPDKPGEYTISVDVTDEKRNKVTGSITITVRENNQPEITDLKVSPGMKVTPGRTCKIECIAQDHDGDELSYEWSASRGGLSPEGNIAEWVAPESNGTYDITVVVRDDRGGEATQTVQIKVGCG